MHISIQYTCVNCYLYYLTNVHFCDRQKQLGMFASILGMGHNQLSKTNTIYCRTNTKHKYQNYQSLSFFEKKVHWWAQKCDTFGIIWDTLSVPFSENVAFLFLISIHDLLFLKKYLISFGKNANFVCLWCLVSLCILYFWSYTTIWTWPEHMRIICWD